MVFIGPPVGVKTIQSQVNSSKSQVTYDSWVVVAPSDNISLKYSYYELYLEEGFSKQDGTYFQ